jgi:hypothetical protein
MPRAISPLVTTAILTVELPPTATLRVPVVVTIHASKAPQSPWALRRRTIHSNPMRNMALPLQILGAHLPLRRLPESRPRPAFQRDTSRHTLQPRHTRPPSRTTTPLLAPSNPTTTMPATSRLLQSPPLSSTCLLHTFRPPHPLCQPIVTTPLPLRRRLHLKALGVLEIAFHTTPSTGARRYKISA